MGSDNVLAHDELSVRLGRALPEWSVVDGRLTRTFRTGGWTSSLLLANAIGHLAELAWHHPELVVGYGSLTVRLTTHSAGGVTDKDLALAAKIEEVVGWRPGDEGGPLEGPPRGKPPSDP